VTIAGTPVYIDLAELRGYRYYTGVVFSAFVSGRDRPWHKAGVTTESPRVRPRTRRHWL